MLWLSIFIDHIWSQICLTKERKHILHKGTIPWPGIQVEWTGEEEKVLDIIN